jgi:hypothetical protein
MSNYNLDLSKDEFGALIDLLAVGLYIPNLASNENFIYHITTLTLKMHQAKEDVGDATEDEKKLIVKIKQELERLEEKREIARKGLN